MIPAYNEARRLPPTLEGWRAFLGQQPYTSEVLVVDDGSADATSRVAAEGGARVIRLEPNQGKGGAVRAGVLAADGQVIAYADADMNVAPIYLTAALARLQPQPAADRPGHSPAAADPGGAGRRAVQAEDEAQGGGLPGAVRAEEAGDPAGKHAEGEVVHGALAAVLLGEALYVDAGHGGQPGRGGGAGASPARGDRLPRSGEVRCQWWLTR